MRIESNLSTRQIKTQKVSNLTEALPIPQILEAFHYCYQLYKIVQEKEESK